MKLDDVTSAAGGLDEKNRSATVKLIDIKVEDDMEKVLKTIHTEFSLLNNRIDNEFSLQNSRIENQFSLMKAETAHLDKRISTVYWVVGIMIASSTALLSIIMSIKK